MTSEGTINSLNLFYPHKKLRNNLTATIFFGNCGVHRPNQGLDNSDNNFFECIYSMFQYIEGICVILLGSIFLSKDVSFQENLVLVGK